MLSTIWSRLRHGVAQNLSAAYYSRGVFTSSRKQYHSFNLLKKHSKIGLRGTHSSIEDVKMDAMHVKILPALKDNYMYLIIDNKSREAAVVDPVEPEVVLKAIKEEEVNLTKILTTHYHDDHAAGNAKMIKSCTTQILEVYGADERICTVNKMMKQDDCFKIGCLQVRCFFTPAHTKGDICYYVEVPDGEDRVVFTGDTMFQAGCGRLFEGTPEQMHEALNKKLAKLPDETKVFGGHENTVQNLAFSCQVEPENDCIKSRFEWALKRRTTCAPTYPSTIGEEKNWNPFMRVQEAAVQEYAGDKDPIKVFACLRSKRDTFKY